MRINASINQDTIFIFIFLVLSAVWHFHDIARQNAPLNKNDISEPINMSQFVNHASLFFNHGFVVVVSTECFYLLNQLWLYILRVYDQSSYSANTSDVPNPNLHNISRF